MNPQTARLFSTADSDSGGAGLPTPNTVSLWRVLLNQVPDSTRDNLSASEWIEASKIASVEDRDRFLTARSVLRAILARYLDCPASAIRFSTDVSGSLQVAEPSTTLRFHLSQSHDLLLVAVSFAGQVGIDVEFMRADLPFETLADHYFEPADAWRLRNLAQVERMQHFYDQWTSSEAQRHLVAANSPSRWSLVNFSPAEGFSAALAVEGDSFALNCCFWS